MSVPKILYHYTTAQGLLGILTGGTIWASDARFLNDASELFHGQRLFQQELEHRLREEQPLASFYARDLDEDLFQLVSGQARVFVTSFSVELDLLSQWRSYGEYAVGFDFSLLRGISDPHSWHDFDLCKVVYDPEEQAAIVRQFVSDAKEGTDSFGVRFPGERRDDISILRLVSRFKDAHFSEEREWRLVAYQRPGSGFPRNGLSHRIRGARLIPYIDVPLGRSVREVVVGPVEDQDLAARGVSSLMEDLNIVPRAVRKSEVPLRKW